MKSLVFMMMLSMFLVSAGVVYLSVNRDPLGGVPHVDVSLDPAPAEQASIEEPTADTPMENVASEPSISDITTGAVGLGDPGAAMGSFPTDFSQDSEPLTTTAFPIPDADSADTDAAGTAATTGQQ